MPSKAKQPTLPKKADTAKNAPAKKASVPATKSTSGKRASPAEGTSGKEARAGKSSSGKKVNLQDPANKREIMADEKLQAVFGKNRVTMFEMNKHLAQHLT